MHDKDLYATILGISAPWQVVDVALSAADQQVEVFIEHDGDSPLSCPQCGQPAARYDTRRRTWRHLDTCQYQTRLTAEVPRVRCPEHGVHQVPVPWSEPNSRFTALFESLAIDWLREASLSAVSRRLRLTWDELDGIQQRAVRRGLARRAPEAVSHLGVDETAFQRRHEYVTVVNDVRGGRVLYVGDGRTREVLENFYTELTPTQRLSIRAVVMDMWPPYIQASQRWVPGWEHKIAFDRFHVAQHLGNAVNDVRKAEHRELKAEGDTRLAGSRFLWLMGPERRAKWNPARQADFAQLKDSALKVARAWALKEAAAELWVRALRSAVEKAWKRWMAWANRSRLAPMQKVARMIREHLWGIVNAILKGVTNATSESLNARIQWIKKNACGYRNRERFRQAILFHCGGLDLYPRPLAHTNS